MIAKSILFTLLFSSACFVFGGGQQPIKNKYARILDEYDIHPPELRFGYPLWYPYNAVQPTAIIFLRSGDNQLYQRDQNIYISNTCTQSAELISNWRGDAVGYRTFYIVPDSSLKWYDVKVFLEALTPNYHQSLMLLVGTQGRYTPIKWTCLPQWPGIVACPRASSFLDVRMNKKNEFLIDSHPVAFDSIRDLVEGFYCPDMVAEPPFYDCHRFQVNQYSVDKDLINIKSERKKDVDRIINSANSREAQSDLQIFKMHWSQREHDVIKSKSVLEAYGAFTTIDGAFITLEIIDANSRVGDYMKLLSVFNSVVFRLRDRIAMQCFNYTYCQLFEFRRFKDIQLVHQYHPDLVFYFFNRYDVSSNVHQ